MTALQRLNLQLCYCAYHVSELGILHPLIQAFVLCLSWFQLYWLPKRREGFRMVLYINFSDYVVHMLGTEYWPNAMYSLCQFEPIMVESSPPSSSSSSSSECSGQGQVLHCELRNQSCSSAYGRSSTTNSRTKVTVLSDAGLPLQTQEPRLQFYQSWIGTVGSFPLLSAPHSLSLSLESEQTLKDLKRSQRHQPGGEESGFC